MYKTNQISDYQSRLKEEQKQVLIDHCNEFEIFPEICAWYDDMEDFYIDWITDNNIYETEEGADARYEDGINEGEFLKFESGEIIRLVV